MKVKLTAEAEARMAELNKEYDRIVRQKQNLDVRLGEIIREQIVLATCVQIPRKQLRKALRRKLEG